MRKAFTLVEVAVVLAIFLVLAYLLVPAVNAVREAVLRAAVLSQEAKKLQDDYNRLVAEAQLKLRGEAANSQQVVEHWVQERLRLEKEEREQEAAKKKLAEAEERRQQEEKSAKAWSRYLSNAMMAVIGLFVLLVVARMTPPVSRAVAAAVVKRVAPQPRAIDVPDEDR
jgi:prepilin-type N-terminal cleavage/methylation domain-containing protein